MVESSTPYLFFSCSSFLLVLVALQLSVQEGAVDQSNQTDMNKLLADQSFVSSILTSLPGVDPNDPHVKDLLASMQSQSEPNKEDDKAPKEEEKK
ncbi:UNVERIFIED_CONTAM: 26S proteasome non-ATPase regulatory subunit [Sesamum radiatum]|uniref:26S proteasome non-ATPase regulatory subunit n=1 Tax=Sesamum radiatum TaxID=300843 RepID=A0AAW2P365_SESRA